MFVRGGQLSLHSLRMLKQVLYAMFKWSIVVWVILLIALTWFSCTEAELKLIYWYYLASFFIEIGAKDHMLYLDGMNIAASQLLKLKPVTTNYSIVAIKLGHNIKLASSVVISILCLLCIIFLWKGNKFSQEKKLRGSKLVPATRLKALILRDNKKLKYQSYYLAGIPYAAHAEATHTLIAGSTGSGKTVLISDLIHQIKQRGDRAIIFDKMGAYTEHFFDPSQDILLNPFDVRSPNWNIFSEVNTDANFDSIAAALIPFEKSGADPFWTKAARTIFAEVCIKLAKKSGATNAALVKTLLKKNLEEAAALVKGTAAQAIIDQQSPKTALSVMAVLSTYLKCLKFLKDEGELFSIKNWIQNEQEQGCIFISSTGDLHSSLTPLISAWIEIAINNILTLERNRQRKIWIILDELPSLHTIPSLEQGLAEVRQFGGCFVLSIQAISQLRDRYGMNGAQTLSSLCNNKVFLRAGDFESARWYSDNIGITEIKEYREALSYGAHEMRDGININDHKHLYQIALPAELISLNDCEGYLISSKNYGIAKITFDYQDYPKHNARFHPVYRLNYNATQETDEDNLDPIKLELNKEGLLYEP